MKIQIEKPFFTSLQREVNKLKNIFPPDAIILPRNTFSHLITRKIHRNLFFATDWPISHRSIIKISNNIKALGLICHHYVRSSIYSRSEINISRRYRPCSRLTSHPRGCNNYIVRWANALILFVLRVPCLKK